MVIKVLNKKITYFLLLIPLIANGQSAIEDTEFGEDIDKITSKNTFEILNNNSKPSNGTPNWNQLDTIYTNKNNREYWQIQYSQFNRYNVSDNSLTWNQAKEFKTINDQTTTNLSYHLNVGDFTGAGYIPKFGAGFMGEINNNNFIITPIIEYGYRKYQTTVSNNYGLYAQKYIGPFRILIGPTITDTSIYKATYGGKGQISYYLNDNDSLNYYFSKGFEPEYYNNNTNIWNVVSNSLVFRKKINSFIVNTGVDFTQNIGIYNRLGFTVGGAYEF